MKKLMLLLLVVISSIALFGCKSSEYKVDGKFMAYEYNTHTDGSPMITTVTVTIKDGEVEGYYIDALQSKKVQTVGKDTVDDVTDDKYEYQWNAKTKKELGDDYGMVKYGNAVAEWDDQAALIEAFMLANGPEGVTTKTDGYIDNVSGVTMKDGGYTTLAAEALVLAKAGKFQAITWSTTKVYATGLYHPEVVMASMVVSTKGVVTELHLDTIQSDLSATFAFSWKAKTKQELGFDYNMKPASEIGKEWFEQADTLTAYVMEKGWTMNSTPEVAGVTMTTTDYFKTFDKLFTFAGSSVK